MKGIGLRKNVMGGHNQSALCSSTKTLNNFNRFSILLSVLMVAITTGIIAGNIIRSNSESSYAASSNITVTNNNQVVTQEQGKTSITKTSNVTIRNTTATYGYNLSARISQNTLPAGTTVQIGSSSSTVCPIATPCTLNPNSASNTPMRIHKTAGSTSTSGDTTTWTITITIPSNIPLGNYVLDIEYDEVARVPMSDSMWMQDVTAEHCDASPDRTFVSLLDRRNNQRYFVQKINGSGANGTDLCWMESNLYYSGGGDNTYGDVKTLELLSLENSDYSHQYYMDPNGNPNFDQSDPGSPSSPAFYGYLYNWCSAMGGQTRACNNTDTTGFDANISICPRGWRLPKGGGEQMGSSRL